MNLKSVVSPEDQGATFVELFFDLVFVFAITQVTHYLAHHLDLEGILRSGVLFWVIWWGWTQFTWTLNAANTEHHHVRVGTLLATGIAFAMAASVEHGFSDERGRALWFALSYIGVRTVGLVLYYKVTFTDKDQREAVAGFATLSVAGLAAVLIGAFLDPSIRLYVWIGAVVADLVAAGLAANRGAWNLHGGHFAERHGLIVIIALGESLIVAGSAAAADAQGSLLAVCGLAVLVTCLLWWTYFGWVQAVMEENLVESAPKDRGPLARDAYSLWHFPLVCGIIALAVGFEGAFHPDDYSLAVTTKALGTGLCLFLFATAGALWRSKGCVLWNRVIVAALTLLVLLSGLITSPVMLLATVSMALIVIVAFEQLTWRRQLGEP